MQITQCKYCGAGITFIKTPAGKLMPCNALAMFFCADARGPETFVTADGKTVRGHKADCAEQADGTGYIPHWASCTGAQKARKRK